MHFRILLSHFTTLSTRPHHERVHRPLDMTFATRQYKFITHFEYENNYLYVNAVSRNVVRFRQKKKTDEKYDDANSHECNLTARWNACHELTQPRYGCDRTGVTDDCWNEQLMPFVEIADEIAFEGVISTKLLRVPHDGIAEHMLSAAPRGTRPMKPWPAFLSIRKTL